MSKTRVTAKYVPNRVSFGEFIAQAGDANNAAAHDIVKALSARVTRSSDEGEGHLADSYKVNEAAPPQIIAGNLRHVSEVYSEHPASAPEEFGGKRNKARHWLANTAATWHVPRKGGKA